MHAWLANSYTALVSLLFIAIPTTSFIKSKIFIYILLCYARITSRFNVQNNISYCMHCYVILNKVFQLFQNIVYYRGVLIRYVCVSTVSLAL